MALNPTKKTSGVDSITMCSRGVWQLQTLSLRYCAHSGSSSKVRQFLKSPSLIQFAKANPQLTVQSELRPGRHPIVVGEYCKKRCVLFTLLLRISCVYVCSERWYKSSRCQKPRRRGHFENGNFAHVLSSNYLLTATDESHAKYERQKDDETKERSYIEDTQYTRRVDAWLTGSRAESRAPLLKSSSIQLQEFTN